MKHLLFRWRGVQVIVNETRAKDDTDTNILGFRTALQILSSEPCSQLLGSTLSKPPSLQLTSLLPSPQGCSYPRTQSFKAPKQTRSLAFHSHHSEPSPQGRDCHSPLTFLSPPESPPSSSNPCPNLIRGGFKCHMVKPILAMPGFARVFVQPPLPNSNMIGRVPNANTWSN